MNYQYQKNIEILTGMEKVLKEIGEKNGGGEAVSFEIKGKDGTLTKVSKEEFARWMINEKDKDSWVGGVFSLESKNSEIEGQNKKFTEKDIKDDKKHIKAPPKESLVYGARGDIDGTTAFVERKGKDGVFKESYYQPRSEEEKKQIIERNRKRREQEKAQSENSPLIQTEEGQGTEKENSQQNQSQKLENKDNNSKNFYYGIGVISLVLVAASVITVWIKKKRKLK